MHEYERLEVYQVKKILKKLEETLRKKFGVSERGQGDEKSEVSRERSKEMRCGLYEENIQAISKSRQMKVSRHLSRQVSRKWQLTNTSVENMSRNKPPYQEQKLDRLTQLSRSYRGDKNFLNRSTRCREGVEIAIRKKT